jgi:hypothetical protein
MRARTQEKADKMPATKETKDERRVKRVTNAINNPTSTLTNLSDALDGLKGVRIFQDEIDSWIYKAIDLQRYDMILEILGRRSRWPLVKLESAVLRTFIFKNPRYLAKFVASPAFHPDCSYHLEMLAKIKDEDIHLLAKLFALPRTGKLLDAMRWLFSWRLYWQLFHNNPDIQRRIQQQKLLLRFWLLVVKRNLPAWRDSLYYPGTGALYLKAFASFKHDLPCMLTCV